MRGGCVDRFQLPFSIRFIPRPDASLVFFEPTETIRDELGRGSPRVAKSFLLATREVAHSLAPSVYQSFQRCLWGGLCWKNGEALTERGEFGVRVGYRNAALLYFPGRDKIEPKYPCLP